jgi:hypothetical protein
LKEGWIADVEINGKNYRRIKIALPSEENRFFSITSVYFDSEEVFSGQYHVSLTSCILYHIPLYLNLQRLSTLCPNSHSSEPVY